MGKVRPEGGINSLAYKDHCLKNPLYSEGQLVSYTSDVKQTNVEKDCLLSAIYFRKTFFNCEI